MAVASGPNVVEDGLVLALDAGNTKSYPGSGTTWTDLIGNNNGTLTNGPTFDRGNGGAIVFDGTNDYVTIPDSEDLEFGSGDFTIEAYIYPTGVPSGAGFACIFAKGAPLQCYFMNSISLNSVNSLSLYVDTNNDGTPYSIIDNNNITGNNTVNQNEWTHIAICRSGDTWKVFTGGVQRYSATHSGTIFNNTDVFSIGDYAPSSGIYPFQGYISNLKVYKGKGLTAAEVQQNYNATKNRYNFVWSLPETITGTVFDFTGGSLPSGMYQDSDGPTVTWGASSVELAGNAPNDGASYPLRVATSFTGDYLFQLSTRIDLDPGSTTSWCSDAGIGLFDTAYNTSDWTWKWAVSSGRIAAQNNCDTPTLYGHTNTISMSGPNNGDVLMSNYVADGGWITMHLYHEPSQSRTRYKVTLGEKDWDASGTQIGNAPNGGVLQVSDSFSGTYYVGISADDDDDECHMNAFRYVAL